MKLCVTERPVKIDCITEKPTNEYCMLHANKRMARWDNFFADYPMLGYDYSHVIYVKQANIIPMTEFEGQQIVLTILPFFHSAVLCLNRDELSRVLLVRYTAMLNYLLRNQPPKLLEYAYEETLSIGKPPQAEPRRFDCALDQIISFEQYRIMMVPKWQSQRMQNEAREFQERMAEMQEGYSSKIEYVLRAPQLFLRMPFESFMIYPQRKTIYLAQNDKLAGE